MLTPQPDGTFDVSAPIGVTDTEFFTYEITDNQGLTSIADATVVISIDADGDGVSNFDDIDDDNDGILDVNEVFVAQTAGLPSTTADAYTATGNFGVSDGRNQNDGDTTGPRVNRGELSVDLGDVAVFEMTTGSGATKLIAFEFSAGSGTNYSIEIENGVPRFNVIGSGAQGSDFEYLDIDFSVYDPADADFTGLSLPDIAAAIQAGNGTKEVQEMAFDVGDLDLQSNRTEGVGANVLDLKSFTGEANSTLNLVQDGAYGAAIGTVSNPTDLARLVFKAGDTFQGRLLVDAEDNAGYALDFRANGTFTNPVTSIVGGDNDGDGLVDSLDIDSDDDGITDNIEAQSTDGYIAPSGVGDPANGGTFVDVDRDGLDDNYDTDSDTSDDATPGEALSNAASVGLIPVNSDGADEVDYLDADSDNDGINDVDENGLGVAQVAPNDADADGDGLKDAYETAIDGNINDGFVVNEGVADPTNSAGAYLPDTDGDVGSGTPTPLVNDLDYRDLPNPPIAENDVATAVPNTPVNINVLADNGNGVDSDPDGDAITVTQIIDPADRANPIDILDGTGALITTPITLTSGTTITPKADGTFDVVVPHGVGPTDVFRYTLSDGTATDVGVVTLNVDTDGDGVADVDDVDDDNDGILDVVEAPRNRAIERFVVDTVLRDGTLSNGEVAAGAWPTGVAGGALPNASEYNGAEQEFADVYAP
ncbi:MAG: hypothetical protein AAFU50_06960, partial [Pseudomonadota bacterium]